MLIKMIIKISNKIAITIRNNKLAECGRGVRISHPMSIYYKNVYCKNDINVGEGANFMCLLAPIYIGNHVMFGPNVTVITGDHRIDVLGKYMTEITNSDKLPSNDLPVCFEGDNWIGANSTILKGVTVKQGGLLRLAQQLLKMCLNMRLLVAILHV